MNLSKMLLVLTIVVLLISNGVLIYQNNLNKNKIDKLQVEITKTQKVLKVVNSNVDSVNSNISDFCGNFTTFSCP